jgi:hypothetical protein
VRPPHDIASAILRRAPELHSIAQFIAVPGIRFRRCGCSAGKLIAAQVQPYWLLSRVFPDIR